jgi:hypothetical protein
MCPMPEDIATCRITQHPVIRPEPQVTYLDGTSVPKVYEFANGPDEPPDISQVAPGLWKAVLPRKPLMIGHALDYHGDPDGPILTDARLFPPGSDLPVQVCEGCDPEVIIAPGPEFTFLIANHQRGCPRYAELAERLAS